MALVVVVVVEHNIYPLPADEAGKHKIDENNDNILCNVTCTPKDLQNCKLYVLWIYGKIAQWLIYTM